VIDFIASDWRKRGSEGHPIEVCGIDLNESRLRNAEQHVRSAHDLIAARFEHRDLARSGFEQADAAFDYGLLCGVLEIIEPDAFEDFVKEVARVVRRGLFIEDLAEKTPGGYPREDLPTYFEALGFRVLRDHWVLQEPYQDQGTLDPMELWPALKVRILFLER